MDTLFKPDSFETIGFKIIKKKKQGINQAQYIERSSSLSFEKLFHGRFIYSQRFCGEKDAEEIFFIFHI